MKRNIFLSSLLAVFMVIGCINHTASATKQFSDVTADSPYLDDINWAVERGIISGYADGTFKPNKIVTHVEFASIFYNLYGKGWYTNEWVDEYLEKTQNIARNHWSYRPVHFMHGVAWGILNEGSKINTAKKLEKWQAAAVYANCLLTWSDNLRWNGYNEHSDSPDFLVESVRKQGVIKNRASEYLDENEMLTGTGFKLMQEANLASYPFNSGEMAKLTDNFSRAELVHFLRNMDQTLTSRGTDLMKHKRKD